MPGYTYILICCDDSYYTGSTNNIEYRIKQHQNGVGSNYTAKRLPVKLVYLEEYPRVQEAFAREHQIKKWSRKKKTALIESNFDRLKRLSKNYTEFGKLEE